MQKPQELSCMICEKLMTDAVLLPCCGKSFCKECTYYYYCFISFIVTLRCPNYYVVLLLSLVVCILFFSFFIYFIQTKHHLKNSSRFRKGYDANYFVFFTSLFVLHRVYARAFILDVREC
jgi:hypothetical protein